MEVQHRRDVELVRNLDQRPVAKDDNLRLSLPHDTPHATDIPDVVGDGLRGRDAFIQVKSRHREGDFVPAGFKALA